MSSDNEEIKFVYDDDKENPPEDFQISSSSSDSEKFSNVDSTCGSTARTSPIEYRCVVCLKGKKIFTCAKCLLKGDFGASNLITLSSVSQSSMQSASSYGNKYSDLKRKLLKYQGKKESLQRKCEVYTQKREAIAKIVDDIEKCQYSISKQLELKKATEAKIVAAQKQVLEIKKVTMNKKNNKPVYISRLMNMGKLFNDKIQTVEKMKLYVREKEKRLRLGSKARIMNLRDFVFPIFNVDRLQDENYTFQEEPVHALGSQGSDDEEDDETVNALIAATSLYWSKPDDLVSTFGRCTAIASRFGPMLPNSGDYSPYHEWSNGEKGGVSSSAMLRNPAQTIVAALVFVTQLVNIIAFYLDLRLPHRLSYSEFSNGDLVGKKFNRKVAKLNANIIYLCSSQNVEPQLLNPRATLPNLMRMFESRDLGRRGPFEVPTQLEKSMEESIEKDLVIFEEECAESDTEWGEFPSDWETVQRGTISDEFFSAQEMTNQLQAQQSMSPSSIYPGSGSSMSQSRGFSSGLASSITSFFRWGNR